MKKADKKQNNLQGSRLFCSKGVLGLEINEAIRGITSFRIIYNVDPKCKHYMEKNREKLQKGSEKTRFLYFFEEGFSAAADPRGEKQFFMIDSTAR